MDKTERLHCNKCGHETKHGVVATRKQEGSESYDEHYHVSWLIIYDMLECRGCEVITVRRRYYFSEWEPNECETHYYPPRVSRRPPIWKSELSKDVLSLLEEVYTALHADSRRLAMMGARALIDMVMLKEVGDIGAFSKKLNSLEQAGFLSAKNREVLEATLEMGSAAAHRGHCPKPEHVNRVMDIVDSGAHITGIPHHLGLALGFRSEHENIAFGNAVGGASVPYRPRRIEIGIGDDFIDARVGWLLDDSTEALLGRLDVFDGFHFEFRQSERKLIVTPSA